jgi:predicted transcriptional regulator
VRRYNNQVFDKKRTRNPVFTLENVEEVINDDFFANARYYFTGIWNQATQGPSGQQDIIKTIVQHKEGLDLEEIARHTNLEHSSLQPALETLRRHDVVAEKEGRWYIIVELFRHWVLNMPFS